MKFERTLVRFFSFFNHLVLQIRSKTPSFIDPEALWRILRNYPVAVRAISGIMNGKNPYATSLLRCDK